MEELERTESSQRQHHNEIQHQIKVDVLITEAQYTRFAMLNPRLFQDGNQWCVGFGENLMDGVYGFGDTPHNAVIDWERSWNESLTKNK